MVVKEKIKFYDKNVKMLRHTKPHKWYSTLKNLSNFDQLTTKEPTMEDIRRVHVY